jgi:hypothetical protein
MHHSPATCFNPIENCGQINCREDIPNVVSAVDIGAVNTTRQFQHCGETGLEFNRATQVATLDPQVAAQEDARNRKNHGGCTQGIPIGAVWQTGKSLWKDVIGWNW